MKQFVTSVVAALAMGVMAEITNTVEVAKLHQSYSCSAPVISPESGTTFADSLTVSISCEAEGATIYYTTDGSEPTKDSTAYRRFKIYGKTTVKAVAYDAANDLYSQVVTADYALGTCANPVIAPEGGSTEATESGYVFYRDGQTVTIDRNGEEGRFATLSMAPIPPPKARLIRERSRLTPPPRSRRRYSPTTSLIRKWSRLPSSVIG